MIPDYIKVFCNDPKLKIDDCIYYITKEVEVDKLIDNTTVVETGYDLWMVLLGMAIGIGFGYYITKKEKKSDGKKTN